VAVYPVRVAPIAEGVVAGADRAPRRHESPGGRGAGRPQSRGL